MNYPQGSLNSPEQIKSDITYYYVKQASGHILFGEILVTSEPYLFKDAKGYFKDENKGDENLLVFNVKWKDRDNIQFVHYYINQPQCFLFSDENDARNYMKEIEHV